MTRAYGLDDLRSRHHLGDGWVVAWAATVAVGARFGLVPSLAGAVLIVLVGRRAGAGAVCLCLAVLGSTLGAHAWASAVPRTLGPYRGWAEVKADPVTIGRGTRLTLEVEGERFDAWVYGAAAGTAVQRQAGEVVWVVGERVASDDPGGFARVRHVVGRFRVEVLADVLPGSPLAVAGNRVRTALRRSADVMGQPTAALFTGLVIGDDTRQPAWMIDQFRRAGLSHLTAVSGQNVAYVLAAALPLLRRLRPWWRWAATVALIAWFMSITRFEPSVLRAGTMAALAATAFVLGRQPRPVRLVALAVIGLVLLDPLLARSVGFWLSVGATVGVCTVGPALAARLPGPAWLRTAVGITVGAQVGVLVPSLLAFGRVSLVSVVANLAAVPVAGGVMLYGLPAGLVASFLPTWAATAVMLPATIGTRWTATVAAVAAAVEPSGTAAVVAWVAVGVVVVACAILRRSCPRT
ncbi:MAG: putative competence protein ComEC [Actinomycetota bacterium]|jgi:competence protein ComEC